MIFSRICLLIFHIIVQEGVQGLYWNWTETGEYFSKSVPVLYDLRIPAFLENIPVCDVRCQNQHYTDLTGFYEATDGKKWSKGKHWGNRNIDFCDWEGVLCYQRTLHVIAIKLQGNNGMNGYVGATLGNLPFLLGVNFGGSKLCDNVAELLTTFKPLFIRFDFAYNKLTGRLPLTIVKDKPHLGKIQLSGNSELTGTIAQDIGLLRDLQVLSLGETNIRGTVPPSLGKLSNLQFLDLEVLGLYGHLNILKGLSNLTYLHLMSNNLQGEIPEDFGNWFQNLVQLNLEGNKLYGKIPSSIGNLKRLKLLNLSKNKRLYGKIPLSFANLVSLEILAISRTSISGFEKGLALNASKLNSFVVANSDFTCSIYELVDLLRASRNSLMQLNAQDCDIFGRFDKINDDTNIEKGIFAFNKLTLLSLAGNEHLTGMIPDPISSLGLLMYLDVSRTNMTGSLPVSYLTKLPLLQEIDIRGNSLMRGDVVKSYMTIDYSVMKKENPRDNFTCPDVRLLQNNGLIKMDSFYYDRRFCHCDQGHYGRGGYCKQCMKGGICPGLTDLMRELNCSANNVIRDNQTNSSYIATNMNLRKGYWPFKVSGEVKNIVKCPWTRPGYEICNPFGRVICTVLQKGRRLLTECDGVDKLCAEGAGNRLCSMCKPGYYKDGLQCLVCQKKLNAKKFYSSISVAGMICCIGVAVALFAENRKISAVIVAILQAVIVFVLAEFGILPSWLAEINILLLLLAIGGLGKSSKAFLKIAVFYVQVSDALVSTAHIWPPSVYDVQKMIGSVINLRLSSLSCQWPRLFTPLGQLSLKMLLPFCVTLAIWICYVLWYLLKGRKEEQAAKTYRFKCCNLCLMFLNLAYFSLVRETTSVLLPCREVERASFMAKYAWIDCSGKDYNDLRTVAVLAIPVYVIGAPLLFFCLLIWKRDHVRNDDEETKKWLGSLFLVYKPEYRVYMEVLLMIRRLAVALLLSFFPNPENILIQTIIVSSFLIVYLAFESHAKPFAVSNRNNENTKNPFTIHGLENVAEVATLIVLLISFIGVQFARNTESGLYVAGTVSGIIAINMLLILLLAVGLIKRMVKGEEDNAHVLLADQAPLSPSPSISSNISPDDSDNAAVDSPVSSDD